MKLQQKYKELMMRKVNFKLIPMTLALAVIVPNAQSQTPPSMGDLDIYSSGSESNNPTLMLMVEGSTFTNDSDGKQGHWADVEIIGLPESSNTIPEYQRYGYYMSISNPGGTNGQVEYPTRLTRMKDAIFYLMDTPGLLPDNYQIGVGRYSGSSLGHKVNGDGITSSINVPAQALGPVSESNNPSSQRYKIKKFVAEICENDRFCTGESPMASAYAEAGAYMMGTKTAKLSKEDDASYITRVLRKNNQGWQYCPPDNRKLKNYIQSGSTTNRIECDDSDWVTINESNVAPYTWTGGLIAYENNPPTNDEIQNISGKREFDVLWRSVLGLPFGFGGSADGLTHNWSPKTLQWSRYEYAEDSFEYENPNDSNDNRGNTATYTYYYDKTVPVKSSLEPDFRYRALRKKYVVISSGEFQGGNEYWQYCPKDKAQLVNYIYSTYRLECNEEDWIPIYTEAQMRDNGFEKNNWWLLGNRPKGIGIADGSWHYNYDLSAGGWDYYYDANLLRDEYPPLPPTLNNGYSSSGVRNSPPEVRNSQRYTYQRPDYSQCSGVVQYDSSGEPLSEKTVDNGIIFLTAGWPRSAIAKPLNEMNMSLTPANQNTHLSIMSRESCSASGLFSSSPINNHWDCIGEYSRYLRQATEINQKYKNPADMPIKTGVVMFTANDEKLQTTGTVDGLPQYDCSSATQDSQKNACLLGQYGQGYGEGGFFQSTSDNPEKSTRELAQAIITMAKNLNNDSGLIPTSMPIVPSNPIQPGKLFNSGYLPFIQPQAASSQSHWAGNLRKYTVSNDGERFEDKSGNSPFNSSADAILSPTNMDLWARELYKSSDQAGGAFENIPLVQEIITTETPRNVYLSRQSSGDLTRYSASNIENLTVDGISNDKKDTVRTLMLKYMGFDIDQYVTGTTDVTKLKGGAPKSMGGIYHSTPVGLIPKSMRTDSGTEYKKYIMFGAMDNALHIVDDETGEEILSYFPQEVLANNGQYKAITPGLTAEAGEVAPSFGVDAPWESYATYKLDEEENSIIAKELYAFGGARLGAKAYYGIDLTGLDKVSSAESLNGFRPKQLFTITPESPGFERLGYTWAKPVVTHINWKGERTLVAILSGGYDATEYDRSDAERIKSGFTSKTIGNAVYVVDAKTGEPLIIAADGNLSSSSDNGFKTVGSNDTLKVTNSHLNFSIPGSVKVLDRDADELADHLYFADLNGQVFRLDIDNIAPSTRARVVRLADFSKDASKPGPRFYEVPAVTIQSVDGKRFATVSVASGDRSNPLRITDPTNDSISLHVTYTASNGNLVTLKTKKDGQTWIKNSGFPTDNSISLSSGGGISIPAVNRKAGTPVIATTIFKSTEAVSSTVIDDSGSATSVNSDPLSPTIVISSGQALISLAKTSDLDDSVKNPNYVYTLYDKDVANGGLFNTAVEKLITRNISFDANEFPDITTDSDNSKYARNGWRAPIKAWGLNDGIQQRDFNAMKAMGPLSAIANKLYVSAYNPVDDNTDLSGCVAQVVGGTEVYQYCLPFGICQSEDSNNGNSSANFQRIDYGKGILPLSWASDKDGLDRKLLTQVQVAAGGNPELEPDAPSFTDTFSVNGVLKPTRWFDYGMFTSMKSEGSSTFVESD